MEYERSESPVGDRDAHPTHHRRDPAAGLGTSALDSTTGWSSRLLGSLSNSPSATLPGTETVGTPSLEIHRQAGDIADGTGESVCDESRNEVVRGDAWTAGPTGTGTC